MAVKLLTEWCVENLGYVPWDLRYISESYVLEKDLIFQNEQDRVLFYLRWM